MSLAKLSVTAAALLLCAAPAACMPFFSRYAPRAYAPSPLERGDAAQPPYYHAVAPLPAYAPAAPAYRAAAAPITAGWSVEQHNAIPAGWSVLQHNSYETTYADWGYGTHAPTHGLIWGLQCKGAGCGTKTPFMMTPVPCVPPLNVAHTVDTAWTDEPMEHGSVYCPRGLFVNNIVCKDVACTALKLSCSPLTGLYRPIYDSRLGGFYNVTDYARVYCRSGEYMDGVKCQGSCTDDFNIYCTKIIQIDI